MGVVPDIASFIRQQLNLVNNKWFSEAKATLYLKGDSDSIQSYEAYLRKKIIKVCSYTTSNSLIKLI